jgi:hypothetical protein
MKKLLEIINEKLILRKTPSKRDLSHITNEDINHIISALHYKSPTEKHNNYLKMRAYQEKGSNPTRLAKSIKNMKKLISRWYIAIIIGWLDCALVFRDEIIDRDYATEDQLDGFLLIEFNKENPSIDSYYKNMENYLDEVNVKY